MVCLPIIALLAFGFGHGWYHWGMCAEFRRRNPDPPDFSSMTFPSEIERRRAETTIQFICYWGPGQDREWLAAVAAAVLYGAIGWRWLGGPLVLLQVVGLMTLAATDLGATLDTLYFRPDAPSDANRHWVYAAQGGLVAGLVAALGLHLLYRSVRSEPLTLRRVFLMVGLAAVFLALVKASVHVRYEPEFAQRREDQRLMAEPLD